MYLKVVISKQISSIIMAVSLLSCREGEWNTPLNAKKKKYNLPLFQSSKITEDKIEN